MKEILKSLLRSTKYRVSGSGALNRFDAIEESLDALAARGFRPTRIVDGGANVGTFALKARRIFPEAPIHLIEPQPGCQPALENIARKPNYISTRWPSLRRQRLGSP